MQRFARETGDIHSLSTVDVKLLALAHSLEVAANGQANLREHPVQVRVCVRVCLASTRPFLFQCSTRKDCATDDRLARYTVHGVPVASNFQHTITSSSHATPHTCLPCPQVRTRQKHKSRPRQLPGWGTVPNPEDWKVVDEAPEDMLTNATGPDQSRIIAAVQSLTLDGAVEAPPALPPPPALTTSTAPPAAGSFGAAVAAAAAAGGAGAAAAAPALVPPPAQPSASQAVQQAPAQGEPVTSGHGEDDDEEDEDEDDEDDGWCTAAKSRNAARRKSRKERRHAAWLEAQQQQQAKQPPQAGAAAPAPAAAAAEGAPPAAEGAEGESEGEDEEVEMEEHEGVELVTDDGEDEGEEGEGEGEGEEGAPSEAGTAATTAATTTTAAAGGLELVDELLPNTTSNVFTVTADFAMQNVMLQMGLRLVTRDGKQITRCGGREPGAVAGKGAGGWTGRPGGGLGRGEADGRAGRGIGGQGRGKSGQGLVGVRRWCRRCKPARGGSCSGGNRAGRLLFNPSTVISATVLDSPRRNLSPTARSCIHMSRPPSHPPLRAKPLTTQPSHARLPATQGEPLGAPLQRLLLRDQGGGAAVLPAVRQHDHGQGGGDGGPRRRRVLRRAQEVHPARHPLLAAQAQGACVSACAEWNRGARHRHSSAPRLPPPA